MENTKQVVISSTDLIDFAHKAGTTKITKVKTVFEREPYDPSRDFYFRLRRKIVSNLKSESGKQDLLDFIENESDERKKPHFRAILDGYFKFLKGKNVSWLTPNKAQWQYQELMVRVNPEVGLQINNQKYLVKLHFKDSKIGSSEAQYILRLMEKSLCIGIYKDYKCALLDLRKGRFHQIRKNNSVLIDDLLEGEAEGFLKIWNGFERRSA